MFWPDFGQKVAKNGLFRTFQKNFALVLSGNGLKRKNESFLNFCKKPHVKKKSFGRDMAENGHFCGARKIFFSEKIFFFEKIFFAQFSKLSHFEHKNAKKKFSGRIPFIVTQGFYLRKFFRIFLNFSNQLFFVQFFQLEMA